MVADVGGLPLADHVGGVGLVGFGGGQIDLPVVNAVIATRTKPGEELEGQGPTATRIRPVAEADAIG